MNGNARSSNLPTLRYYSLYIYPNIAARSKHAPDNRAGCALTRSIQVKIQR
jgi:hypothetical protein